jgi:fibronectin type 3 domain-containing protein
MSHVTADAVTLRWNAVVGANGYVVTRSDTIDGTYTEVARTTGDVFVTDSGVDTTALVYYRVQATGSAGVSAFAAAAVSSLSAPAVALPDSGVLSFDLGSGVTAPGAIRLDATSAYSAAQRYGFVDVAQVTATDRGTTDATRSDFVTVGDTELVIDLPNGDYRVDLIAGDATAASDIGIVAEQITKVQPTTRAAGQFLEMSFDIALVDGQLNLDVSGTAPQLNALVLTATTPRTAATVPTAWSTGGSTVQSYTADYAP